MEPIDLYLKYIPDVLFKFAAALVCGGLIGGEREIRKKPAGLRTSILVCFGAVIYVLAGNMMFEAMHITALDPTRMASQIVVGVGFLGAGAILRAPMQITGLTSAATIWVVAAIGVVIGMGFPLMALTLTIFTLITLEIIGMLENKFLKESDKEKTVGEDKNAE
jgi:putative Mg2+ transporter-C (MgtC) family protein